MITAPKLADRGLLPLPLLRLGARNRCARRLRDAATLGATASAAWVQRMGSANRALPHGKLPKDVIPNGQGQLHNGVPPAFFEAALGTHLQRGSGFFPAGDEDLDSGEAHMLGIISERAQLQDGQQVLDLACGWGALPLWVAEHHPNSTVVAFCGSPAQRDFIESRIAERGLSNIMVHDRNVAGRDITGAAEAAPGPFDRILSIELFERIQDWRPLLGWARRLLLDDGRMFVQMVAHRTLNYPMDRVPPAPGATPGGPRGDSDWMEEHFLQGRMMPADDLLPHLLKESGLQFQIEDHSIVSGRHYSRTAKLWRENIEQKKQPLMPVLHRTYGAAAPTWFQRWRLFFLGCEELFGYEGGSEWGVSHYRLAPTPLLGSREPSQTARSASTPEASATGQAVTH